MIPRPFQRRCFVNGMISGVCERGSGDHILCVCNILEMALGCHPLGTCGVGLDNPVLMKLVMRWLGMM